MSHGTLNPLAQRVWARLLSEYPAWEQYFDEEGGDLEVAIPAPPGSNADHLVIFTARGEDIWVRYLLPFMCYTVDDDEELVSIIKQLLAEQAIFVVTMDGSEWAGTTLIRPGFQPSLEPGQTAHIVAWSGIHDKTISGPPRL